MYTSESIILRFREVHGDRYDYTQMEYTRTRNKVNIICKNHGIFTQTPQKHISGSGCPNCGIERAARSRTTSLNEFYIKCNDVHMDKYSYLDDFTHTHKHITIICPHHGEFKQITGGHIRGQGCPKCSCENHPGGYGSLDDEYLRNICPAFLYHITLESDDEIFDKVGITIDSNRRFYEFSRYYRLTVMSIVKFETMLEAYNEEQLILSESQKYRPNIKFFGHTECIKKD